MAQFADLSGHGVLAVPVAPLHLNRRFARRTCQNRMFQFAQPRARRQSESREAILPNLDARFLLNGVCEARNIVIDKAATNAKGRFFVQHIIEQFK